MFFQSFSSLLKKLKGYEWTRGGLFEIWKLITDTFPAWINATILFLIWGTPHFNRLLNSTLIFIKSENKTDQADIYKQIIIYTLFLKKLRNQSVLYFLWFSQWGGVRLLWLLRGLCSLRWCISFVRTQKHKTKEGNKVKPTLAYELNQPLTVFPSADTQVIWLFTEETG